MATATPLNPAQQAAVDHSGSHALVIAGAGSGKTRVITQRIARILATGLPPRSIAAVTFTNKASEEMGERLGALVGTNIAKDVWTSTFHALGSEMLRAEARHVSHGERFVIYDGADTTGVVKEILREMKAPDKRWDAAAILSRISNAKNALVSPDELPTEGEYDEIASLVYPRYVAAMNRLRALDFDDLILVPLRLLSDVQEVRTRWHERLRHLLVDEFQDTSRAQLLFVKMLAGPRTEVFCVGDDDQAIYGWRGADVRNVIDFAKHFPGARVLALEQNYRSRQPVLDVANAVIAKAVRAWPKKLFSDRIAGPKVSLIECADSDSETRFTVDTIREVISKGSKRSEIAVLYRSNSLSKPLEEALRLLNVPYRLIGGTSFYERREVKDLLAYLRLALHPEDDLAFRRVVNYPARGIGDTTLERIERHAKARGVSLFAAAGQSLQVRDLDERAKFALGNFEQIVRATRQKMEGGAQLADVARGVASTIDLRGDIVSAGPSPAIAQKRMQNLEGLYKTLAKVPVTGGLDAARLALVRLSLRFADEGEEAEDRVVLSTLHGSKGLEFGTVFLIGCDEGIMPHARTDAPKATDIVSTIDPSEERRLFYVGVTRAKDKLYLVRAKLRAMRGASRATAPSRFLADIPEALLEKRAFKAAGPLNPQDLAAQAKAAREMLAAMKAKRDAG